MNATRDAFEPDDEPRCSECGKLTDADPCAGSRTHDEGFDRCICETPAAEVKFEVDYYDPSRGGVWTRSFGERGAALAFANGRRCYAKPATVREVAA